MKRRHLGPWSVGLTALLMVASRAQADGPAPATAPAMPADLARHVREATDAVLENHVDPPARQQMILAGLRALYREAGLPTPVGLGRRVSEVATAEQVEGLLKGLWPRTTAGPIPAHRLEEALLSGLIAPVPGGAQWMTAKEHNVAEQLAGNRYVGLHISIAMDEKVGRPAMAQIFEGGPADRAGVKSGDLLEEIAGVDTKGMKMAEVIDRLRGDEGTAVTIKVRTPKDAASRTYTITRAQLPHPTIEGIRKQAAGRWKLRLDVPAPIGYLKLKEISPSTPHELRRLARQAEEEGLRALVLDLRALHGGDTATAVHAAVLLADSLLESGVIGRYWTARGETTYQADPDALLRGRPIAVLVDQETSGPAEWLAAALQDNRRAVIVGTPTRGAHRVRSAGLAEMERASAQGREAHVQSAVPVGDGRWWIVMATGRLERGDGRPLVDREDATAADGSFGPARGGVRPDHEVPSPPAQALVARGPGGAPVRLLRPVDRTYAAAEPKAKQPVSPVDPPLDAAVTILRRTLEGR